jgi:hypothetical protein
MNGLWNHSEKCENIMAQRAEEARKLSAKKRTEQDQKEEGMGWSN